MWNLDADYPCPIKRAALYNEMLIVGRVRLPPCLFEIAASGLFRYSIRMSLSSNDESWLHSSTRIVLSIGISQYGGALYDTIYYVSFATLCEKLMCSVVKGQLIGELAIRCACSWAFRGQEWKELRGLAASIMYDHSQVLFESRGVECGERAFDAKQV